MQASILIVMGFYPIIYFTIVHLSLFDRPNVVGG